MKSTEKLKGIFNDDSEPIEIMKCSINYKL